MQRETRIGIVMALLLYALTSTTVLSALLTANFTMPATGQIAGVGVSVTPSSLNWGNLEPGASKTLLVQVTNTGNVPVTLSMTTQGLPSYLSLAWDKSGAVLQAGQSTSASFTLTASAQAPPGNFAFNITITGTGGE